MALMAAISTAADLQVVDLVSQTQTTGACTSVDVEGFYAYLTDGKTLRILDISTPETPQPVGTLTLTIANNIQDLAVWRGVACLACGNDGLKIVDVSRPAQPLLMDTFKPSSFSAVFVEMQDGLAYVGNNSTPNSLVAVYPGGTSGASQVGSFATGAPISDVYVADNFAFVTSTTNAKGLQIIDISTPSLPSLRGTFTSATAAESVCTSGNLAYIAEGSGMEIVDISNPASPTLAGTYSRPAQYLETITVADGLAYAGLTFEGFEVVDVSKPTAPRLIDTYDPGKQPSSSTFADGLFYGTYGPTNTGGGLVILRAYLLPTAPLAPTGLVVQSGADRALVRWDANREPDLAGYNVYRASNQNGPYNRLNGNTLITVPNYTDTTTATSDFWYKVSAVDTDGNESTLAGPVKARPGLIVVWLPDLNAAAGSTVRIPINVEDAQGINGRGIDIVMTYDASIIDPASVTVERTAVTSRVAFFANAGDPGVVSISGIGQVELVGEGHLFDIVGRIQNGAPLTCGEIVLSEVRFYDQYAQPLSVNIADTGQLCRAVECKQGDLNNDGVVDSADALIALNISVGISEPLVCSTESSDLNGDGRIDSADAVMILRLASGKPVNPPQTGKEGLSSAELPLEDMLAKDAITISVENVEAQAGSSVAVPVRIDNPDGLSGFDFTVSYPADRARLTFEGIEAGSLTQAFGATSKAGVGFVKISMSAEQALSGKQDNGSLVTLMFKVESGATEGDTLPVAVNGADLKGQYGESFDWYSEVGLQKGGIQITGLVQGTIVCTVRDANTQQPIRNATASLTPSILPPVTQNVNGVYTFTPVPAGAYTVRVEANGYQGSTRSISVSQGQTRSEIFSLHPTMAEGEGEGQAEGEGQPEGEGEGQASQHTLTILVQGNGSVEPGAGNHTYDHGDQATLSATPAEGWEFDHWEGGLSGSSNPAYITIAADVTVTAVFKEQSKGFFLCAAGAGASPRGVFGDACVLGATCLYLFFTGRSRKRPAQPR